MMTRFCSCGRIYPCKHEGHEEFDSTNYAKKHIKKRVKPYGGYSAQREQDGEFQPGVDKENFK